MMWTNFGLQLIVARLSPQGSGISLTEAGLKGALIILPASKHIPNGSSRLVQR